MFDKRFKVDVGGGIKRCRDPSVRLSVRLSVLA